MDAALWLVGSHVVGGAYSGLRAALGRILEREVTAAWAQPVGEEEKWENKEKKE